MKAYDEKCLFDTLTIDNLGVTQGQGRKCYISLFKPFVITLNHLNDN